LRSGARASGQDHCGAGEEARVIVEGVRMIKKHIAQSQNNPQGSIIERDGDESLIECDGGGKFDGRRQRGADPGERLRRKMNK